MRRGTDSPTTDESADARVVVAVRIRPLRPEHAMERYDTSCLYCTAPDSGSAAPHSGDAPTTVTIINPTTKEQTDFAFDRVFEESDGQSSVYTELVEDALVQTMERGGDLTVVAYGQTGSGKTFTMLGERGGTATSPLCPKATGTPSSSLRSPSSLHHQTEWLSPDSGVFLRAVNSLMSFRDLRRDSCHVIICLQAVEIYNDTFIDLLAKGSHKGDQRPGWQRPNNAPSANGVIEPREVGENLVLSNALRVPLETLDDVQRCFDISHKNRSVSATNMNDVSSRSHAIFLIEMVMQPKFMLPDGRGVSSPPDMDAVMEHEFQQWMGPSTGALSSAAPPNSFFSRTASEFASLRTAGPGARQLPPGIEKNPSNDFEAHPLHICRITLVDLAGSERIKRSGVVGKGMQEAVFVNSSLSTLGLVVHSLCAKQQQSTKHIPFRDSKMTRVLRPSFTSPSAKVVFVTNISPTSQSYVETLNSMRFASRLKDLKYSTPPQSSGPSLGLLLNDERLQRLRQQMDEMSADVRIYQLTCGVSNGAAVTSLRRELVHQHANQGPSQSCTSPGASRSTSITEELLVRPLNIKDALHRCRSDAMASQGAAERESNDIRQSILHQMITSARKSGRINEDETELTMEHLRDSISRMEAELQLTKSTCAADIQQWRDRVESVEVQGDAISVEYNVLVKRKRELYHENIHKRTELDDLDELACTMKQAEQAAAARLAVEKALLDGDSGQRSGDAAALSTLIEWRNLFLQRLSGLTELLSTLRCLDRYNQQDRDATAPSLVAHELSASFSRRLAAVPLKDLFDPDTVRTSEGRHRLLNERLEQSSGIYTVSPLEYYLCPEAARRPNKFIPWATTSRMAVGNAHNIDTRADGATDESDDDYVYDEDIETTAEHCASREPSSIRCDPPDRARALTQTTLQQKPLGEQLVSCYIRVIALYGHLMRVTTRAEKRKRRTANAPLLSNTEAKAIFIVLDAVEVDGRVIEDIARSAVKQLEPPLERNPSTAALSPHGGDLRSPASAAEDQRDGSDSWGANPLPAMPSAATKEMASRIARILKGGAEATNDGLRFVPCLARCLQALTLISLYEALMAMRLPGAEGGAFQRKLLRRIAKRLVHLQATSEFLPAEDAAILKGCQYACRASAGSSGGAWTLEDLNAAQERSKLKERIRSGTFSAAVPNTPPKNETERTPAAVSKGPLNGPSFLWTHPRSRDLSPLRGLATRCLLLAQLVPGDASGSTTDSEQVPTPCRFLECLLLVLRQGAS